MRLWRLASWISFRHLSTQVGRTLVSVAGVALGVAVFVAIRLASGSAISSFKQSVDILAGPANLQISAGTGRLDETRFAQVSRLEGVTQAWPMITALASNPERPGESLLVLGMDFFGDPRVHASLPPQGISPKVLTQFLSRGDALAVSESFARRNTWRTGDSVQLSYAGRRHKVTVIMLLADAGLMQAYGGDVGLMDIAAAQETLGQAGTIDRIDLVADPKHISAITEAGQRIFPVADIEPPARRGTQVEAMIASFRLNLLALALVALFVGAFLIFNSVSLSVVQRRSEIGIARSVGVSQKQILALFLLEGLLYGLAGSLAGLALGVVLARAALESVSGTVSTMYATVRPTGIVIDGPTMLIGFALGMAASLISGLIPAVEASLTPPGIASREGSLLQKRRINLGVISVAAAATGGLAAAAVWAALRWRIGWLGFASAGLLLIMTALVAPVVTVALGRIAVWPARLLGRVEGLLAARWLVLSLERTAVIIAALAAAVAMLVALNMMVGSFRRTVEVWMEQTVRADLFVEPASRTETGVPSALPTGVVEMMQRLPDVQTVDSLRATVVQADGQRSELYAFDLQKLKDFSTLIFMGGEADQRISSALQSEGVLVSETFRSRFGKGLGDTIRLQTPNGSRPFMIHGVFFDYTTESGLIIMHRPLYARLWRDETVNTAAIYAKPGADLNSMRRALLRRAAGVYDISAIPNRTLKQRALDIFDRTFAVTNALKVVTVAIAVLGIITTMASLILQRRRDLGVLRAVGGSKWQIAKMALIESALIGLFGTIIGFVCGPLLALVLISVINSLFFGWTIIPTLEARWFVEAAIWVATASLIAGIIPARFASRLQPAEAVRNE